MAVTIIIIVQWHVMLHILLHIIICTFFIAVSDGGAFGIAAGIFCLLFCIGPVGLFGLFKLVNDCKKKKGSVNLSALSARRNNVRHNISNARTTAMEDEDEVQETAFHNIPHSCPQPSGADEKSAMESAPPGYDTVCDGEHPPPQQTTMIKVFKKPLYNYIFVFKSTKVCTCFVKMLKLMDAYNFRLYSTF